MRDARGSALEPGRRALAVAARSRRAGARRRLLAGLAAVITALALSALAEGSRAIASGAGEKEPGAMRELSPPEAYRRAVELMQGPDPTTSLPYFRRAVEAPAAPARVHLEYSWMLNDAAVGTRLRLGKLGREARSSYEQVALERESMIQLDLAERASSGPAERALIRAYRGKHFAVWGLPWDALEAYRGAARLDPGWKAHADRMAVRIHHPERAMPADAREFPAPVDDRPGP
jgi:hypothetical protein